jgi:hypothetical protein
MKKNSFSIHDRESTIYISIIKPFSSVIFGYVYLIRRLHVPSFSKLKADQHESNHQAWSHVPSLITYSIHYCPTKICKPAKTQKGATN